MDNVTHALAGAALGQAGLKRLSGLGMAALVIGANLPDVDALAIAFGDALTARRGWTHGPVAMLLLPALLTAALVAFDNLQLRRGTRPLDRPIVRPRQLLLLSILGCLTHPLLDLLNTYGVRLLMPFSERWFHADALQIIDPWVWIALGLGVFVARRRDRSHRADWTRPARVALGLVLVYIGTMVAGSWSARGVALREIAAVEHLRPARVMAAPVFVNSTRRELVYDLGDRYRFGTLSWRPQPEVEIRPQGLLTNLDHPLAQRARARPEIDAFLYWSRFPYFVLPGDTVGGVIEARDARFRGERRFWRNPFVRTVPVSELPAAPSESAPESGGE